VHIPGHTPRPYGKWHFILTSCTYPSEITGYTGIVHQPHPNLTVTLTLILSLTLTRTLTVTIGWWTIPVDRKFNRYLHNTIWYSVRLQIAIYAVQKVFHQQLDQVLYASAWPQSFYTVPKVTYTTEYFQSHTEKQFYFWRKEMTFIQTLSISLSVHILSELNCICFLPERERVDTFSPASIISAFVDVNNNAVARQPATATYRVSWKHF